jgi:sugar lactone lactonase YvrE
MAIASLFDSTACRLGEGALWHPDRGELFWVDILDGLVFARGEGASRRWRCRGAVSALGIVDERTLLVAHERSLLTLDLDDGTQTPLVALEADDPRTRSNDGRADPWGGFWIGTMGRAAEPGLGAIYRFHCGMLHRLVPEITIPNAIAFSPDRHWMSFADSARGTIWRQPLDAQGWPRGEPAAFAVWPEGSGVPDGAVFDAEGCLWVAVWGGSAVVRLSPEGEEIDRVSLPASQVTCPAFGGPDLTTLFATTAADGLSGQALERELGAGCVFTLPTAVSGLPEPRVIL